MKACKNEIMIESTKIIKQNVNACKYINRNMTEN